MDDAWKTAAEINELVLHHPGSKDSVKWYNPMTWVSYALQRGNFNKVLSNIDTYLLTCARGHLNAAREGDIWKSVKYFADNYCYVIHPTDGKIKLEMRDYQHRIIDSFIDHRQTVILASRQCGKCVCGETNIILEDGKDVSIKELFENF